MFGVLYTYITELFNTKCRAISLSVSMTLGKLLSGLCTYVIYLMNLMHLHAMSFIWVLGALSILALKGLPETKGHDIKN
jgi:hypothetical protein